MQILKNSFIQIASMLLLLVLTCSFACRNNSAEDASNAKEKILQTEKETLEMDASKAEIEKATAKVDSLLNDLDNQ